MKLGQALVLAASAAAAVGAAVYAKKKIENSEQADGLAAKGFQWKDLPEELNVIRKVKKNNPDKIIITTDGVRDADEPFYDKQEEDEVVTRLAEDIREVMSEDIFEAEETADDISEELVEKTTVADLVSNTEKDRSAPQKKAKQKKYYAPVDFTFTEEAAEAPVAFENAMDHIKKIELPEEEKAELEAHEDYSDVVAEDNKIFDEYLNAPIPNKEETKIFTAEEIEENVGLRDENEEKAFKDFVAAIEAETHPASAPLVVKEVTAIPDSEAEYIKTDTVLIPTIEKISDDDNEEEITEEEQPSPEAEELPAVEEIEEIPAATEIAEIPAVEEIEEIPTATETAELPAVEEIEEIPTATEIAELPAVEEIEELPAATEIAELPAVEEIEEIPAATETAELPAVEVTEEIPAATETAELPAVEVIEEIPTATEIAELPAVEEIEEIPAVEEIEEIPTVQTIPVEEETEQTPKAEEKWEIPAVEGIPGEILGGFAEEIASSEYEKAEANEIGAFFYVPESVVEATKAAIAMAEKAEEAQEETTAEEEQTPALQPDAPKPTLDFFDKPVEEKKSIACYDEVSMEDLFGDLLADTKVKTETPITNPNEVFSMYENESAEEDDFDNLKDEKIEKEQEKIQTVDKRRVIVQEIADNIENFAMLLEPLYSVKENKVRVKSGIIFDWEMRIQTLDGDPLIKSYWRNNFNNYEIWTDEKHMEKAEELLSMLYLVGIERDTVKEVVIDHETMDYYSAQSEHMNNDFNLGETAVVVRPCWKINGKPLVKGEITKKAPFADFGSKNVSLLEQMLRANKCEDGDVNIPVTEESFFSADLDIPYIQQAVSSGVCKCAIRRMEGGTALAFFYEVINEGESMHRDAGTLRFEVTIDKNCKLVGKFKGETV